MPAARTPRVSRTAIRARSGGGRAERRASAARRAGARACCAPEVVAARWPSVYDGVQPATPIGPRLAGDDDGRRDRAGLRRAAAGGRLCASRAARWSASTSTRARSQAIAAGAPTSRTFPPSSCAQVSGSLHAGTALCAARRSRRGADLRPDAAHAPTASPTSVRCSSARARSPRCCGRASWWCSSRRPTRARRASAWRRCSRSRACAPARDFHLAFSPERVDPGRTDFTLRNTPKVVGGLTRGVRAIAREELYGLVCDEIVRVSTPEAAELTKLLENIFRSVNIALVNELAMLTDRMGIDVWEVVDAAATKPYGFMRFEPGPGMGGHCLPVDPFYLAWRAREFDMPTEFIELAGKINQQMPYHCVAQGRAVAQRRWAGREGRAHRDARGQLQAGHRRHARVAGAEDHRAAARARRGGALPRPARARAARVRAADAAASRRCSQDADLALIVTAHPGVDHELVARARASWSTSAASREARRRRNVVRLCERRAGSAPAATRPAGRSGRCCASTRGRRAS